MSQRPPKRSKTWLLHRRDLEREQRKQQARKKRKKNQIEEESSVDDDDDQANDNLIEVRRDIKSHPSIKSLVQQPMGSNGGKHRKKGISCSKQLKEKQRFTELSAVGHILADEVHFLLNHQEEASLNDKRHDNTKVKSNGERTFLKAWVDSVQQQLYKQDTVILENVELVKTLRQSTSKAENLRDDLMVLRTQTRRVNEEADRLEKELIENRQSLIARQGASHFLSALENLAKECHSRKI